MAVFRSFAEASVVTLFVMLGSLFSPGAGFIFSPVGYAAVMITFFLEIFGDRW